MHMIGLGALWQEDEPVPEAKPEPAPEPAPEPEPAPKLRSLNLRPRLTVSTGLTVIMLPIAGCRTLVRARSRFGARVKCRRTGRARVTVRVRVRVRVKVRVMTWIRGGDATRQCKIVDLE